MIKDIEFAFFAQLSYLNWNKLVGLKEFNFKELKEYKQKQFTNFLSLNDIWENIKIDNLEPKVENGILMYHENDKRLFGVFGTKKNNRNSQLIEPLYNFNGWQFIYSADNIKLFSDRYNLKVEDNGFFACAFMKDNDIVVAYRGTEPDTIEDLLTDLEIGFLNHNHSQLVCAYLFLEHVKSLYPDKNIHITGHSLGGCLAQYAFVCTDKQYPTVTWNALGVGKHKHQVTKNIFWGNDITAYLELYSLDIKRKLETSLLNTKGEISDDFFKLTEQQMLDLIFNKLYTPTKETLETGFHKITEKEVGGIKISIGTSPSERNHERQKLTSNHEKELETKLKISSIHIYWLLRGIKNYQISFDKTSNNITNFYNSLDWTALLQTREGKAIDVLTGNQTSQEMTDDSQWRIIKQSFKNLGFSYHSVNDFLLYMDANGMIQSGKYSQHFTKNLIKTLYLNISSADINRAKEYKKLDFIKEKTTNKTEKNLPFEKFHITCTKTQRFGNKKSEISLANIKYELSAAKSLESSVSHLIPYREFDSVERQNGDNEVGVFIIGETSNVHLCGIKGGETTQLIKIGEPIQKNSLAENIEKAKKNSPIDCGRTIGWGVSGGGTKYEVVKYSNGSIVRKSIYG